MGKDHSKKGKKELSGLDPGERELFLNAVNQGVIGPKVVGQEPPEKGHLARARLKKKGQVDCTIDLHGMYAQDAAAALLEFIRREKARGSKTMLVIHGKGSGVLKKAVWSIIRSHPDIDDFQQASWRQGGAGAIIIRLNQKRRP